ncbi:zinc finger protein 618-like [Melanaphis sacchari]|uniref:zinc finger protein 618-like n=1 Tax=Melanaphis sacchari TaxID=742174 RepID=UPI000DC146AC|nr:zinc finger protein 618-like [Melanaphis sacchari]
MLTALRNNNRLNCCAHVINTVLRNLFDSKFLNHEEDGNKLLNPVVILLNECKHLVKFMKSSGKNSELSQGLVQEVETRWNTRLLMFQSVKRALPEIIQLYGEHFNRIQNINTELLEKITIFLEPFKKASDELEGDKYPTIQKVVLYQLLLKKHLKTYAELQEDIFDANEELTPNSIMQKLGKRGLEFMKSKFKLAEEHEIAIFLSPKFKCLKMFSEPDKSRIFQNIGLKLLEIELKENITPENLHQEYNVTIQKNTSNSSLFSEWEDGENNEDLDNRRKYEKELEAYKKEKFDVIDDNLLDFWKRQNHIFPYLSVLARQILAIPASSASSERSFSVAGRLIEERRSCLSGTSVDSILFLNNHFKNKK